MTEILPGREPVQIVELRQGFCTRTYGVLPCTASGPIASACFNTRLTCQDPPNFVRGERSLFFSRGGVAEQQIVGAPYIIPSLAGVSTSPSTINIAGSNPDSAGLGNRALCTVTFYDHPHTDVRVDPYVSTRGYDPLSRGSFWTKWLYRNRYRQNMVMVVYEGYAGQALSAMRKRTYFVQSVEGPDDSGMISIQGKDVLSRLEERKSQAPKASPGELYIAITAVQTSFEVAGAVLADYPAAGTLIIGDEIMTYTSRSLTAHGVTFSGVVRGTDGSTAATHNAGDAVQECLRFTNQAVNTVIETLLATYGDIPLTYLDTVGWANEVSNYLPTYLLTTLIVRPTAVTELVSQIQQQTLAYLWWDELVAKVKMKVVRGIDVQPKLLTAEKHIISGSFRLEEKPRERASQVWIYYGRDKHTRNMDDPTAYSKLTVIADLASETPELYDEPSIRKIYANWLVQASVADTTASKIILRYVDIPSQVTFSLDAKDRTIWVGDTVTISHYLDVDQFGNRRLRNWTIISAEEVIPGEVVQYVAEDTTLYGKIAYVMAAGSPDYPGATLAPFKSCYIGNAAGLLSDGNPAGRIN